MKVSSYNLNLASSYASQKSLMMRGEQTDTKNITEIVVSEKNSLAVEAGGELKNENKTINFSLNSSVSNLFSLKIINTTDRKLDPLVINTDGNIVNTDGKQLFEFDLNSDNTKDSIAYLSKGNSFLAYDKNGNGIIDDGSELFGTKSGNGFVDLAEHDETKDGVIDESDSIFKNLSLWQKTTNSDNLYTLKDKNIGAIFLKNIDSKLQLQTDGKSDAFIQSSGVAVTEDGKGLWVSHVDFVLKEKESEQNTTQQSPLVTKLSQMSNSSTPAKKSKSDIEKTIEKLKKELAQVESRIRNATSNEEAKMFELQKQTLTQEIAALEKMSSLDMVA